MIVYILTLSIEEDSKSSIKATYSWIYSGYMLKVERFLLFSLVYSLTPKEILIDQGQLEKSLNNI